MTTTRPAADDSVWSHNPPKFGRATGQTRVNLATGEQEHLITWHGDRSATWVEWRHVHDKPASTPTGGLYCTTCRARKDVVDEFQDSAYESSREVHYTVKVMACGHSHAFGAVATDTAP